MKVSSGLKKYFNYNKTKSMAKIIRIGTRDSALALWQAKDVEHKLQQLGYQTQIVAVKSTGDLILDKPLYELGITGVFTKTLDIALINGDIDIAVHSSKDVPTALPFGIVQGAVLERANPFDLLVHKGEIDFLNDLNSKAIIATGSLRRKAQWANRYPNHQFSEIRGNVNSRLQKLQDNLWQGTIFAAAGLERINVKPDQNVVLDWMIPAPAQGVVMCVCSEKDSYCLEALAQLNHSETEICIQIERQFLKRLEGGCTAPIGALATVDHQKIYFKGGLFSLDGKQKIVITREFDINQASGIGVNMADEVIDSGGKSMMIDIKKNSNTPPTHSL